MKSLLSVANVALRAALWRTTRNPATVGLVGLCGWCFVSLAFEIAAQYALSHSILSFSVYGLNASIALLALTIAVAAFFVPPYWRHSALASFVVIGVLYDATRHAASLAGIHLLSASVGTWFSTTTGQYLILAVSLVWWIGATLSILRTFSPERRPAWQLARATALCAVLLAVGYAFPHDPVFKSKDFDRATANQWEAAWADITRSDGPPPRSVDRAQVEIAQPSLMDVAITSLAPQRKGVVDIYSIGMAAWSDQDVFIKELEGALEATAKSLPIQGRVVRLINHPDTAFARPMASRQNFAAAVRAIGQIMDKDEDVLLVFVTSHGSRDGAALQFRGALMTTLSPEDVAQVLDQEGIINRIVIVSACYSGVFLQPLANDNSIVLTAADENHPSFGCSNEREWTYFGDAFFNQSLRAGRTLQEAFENAKELITTWERRDALTHSNPQAHFGPNLVRKLLPIYAPKEAAASSPVIAAQ